MASKEVRTYTFAMCRFSEFADGSAYRIRVPQEFAGSVAVWAAVNVAVAVPPAWFTTALVPVTLTLPTTSLATGVYPDQLKLLPPTT
jgi:hypothetical protein